MRAVCIAILLVVPAISGAAEITVGSVSLTIPNPNGYSPVTQQMAGLYEVQKHFVASTNEELVAFIPERAVSIALKNEIPELPRRFTVQTAKDLVEPSVSTSEFGQLKSMIKTQNTELMKQVEKLLPGLMEEMNEGITKEYDIDLAFSVSQMVPLPVHEETERTLAYSALLNYDMKDEAGQPAPFVAAVTATFVHVKGKVLFLYSYAEEAGLAWSREASSEWADAVVAANPSDFQAKVNEALPSRVSGIDWGKAADKAVSGALLGLIVGLIAWAVRRGKAS